MKGFTIKNIKVILMIVTLGGFLFGYNSSIINGAILMFSESSSFYLSKSEVGIIVSILPLAAMIGAILFGKITDLFGRKKVITFISLMFIISILVISASNSVLQLILGRFGLGFSIGAINTVVPIYIAEISNENNRGKMVMTNQVMLVFSQFIAYLVNYIFYYLNISWRYMFLIAIIPSIIIFIGSFFIPETVNKRNIKKEYQRLRKEFHIISKFEKNKRRFSIFIPGILLGIVHQFTGINIIMYYSSYIFSSIGFKNEKSFFINIILGFVSLAGVLISFKIIESYERKTILLIGLEGCSMSLFLIILLNSFLNEEKYYIYMVALFIIVFVFCFQAFVGGVVWLLISEIFPEKIRGIGMGLSSAALWFSNFLSSLIFPIIISEYGLGVALILFFTVTTISIPYVKYLKNTRGISLKDLEKATLNE